MSSYPKEEWCRCESASGAELNGFPPKQGDAKWLGDPKDNPQQGSGFKSVMFWTLVLVVGGVYFYKSYAAWEVAFWGGVLFIRKWLTFVYMING